MNFNFITPTLIVGQKIITQEFADALIAAGVTRVINLWSGNPEDIWKGDVLILKQDDDGTPRPKDQVLAGIAYAAAVPEGQVLYVHCQWGLGRAPTMAYAILRSRGVGSWEAMKLININRPVAKGNWEHYMASVEEAMK
jgi:predicted protein tyrosine phosphatase